MTVILVTGSYMYFSLMMCLAWFGLVYAHIQTMEIPCNSKIDQLSAIAICL